MQAILQGLCVLVDGPSQPTLSSSDGQEAGHFIPPVLYLY